jgi:hypothetical protein
MEGQNCGIGLFGLGVTIEFLSTSLPLLSQSITSRFSTKFCS